MMEMLQCSIFEAAAKGCVNSLQQLLVKDALILERDIVVINSFNETPLHVAAMLGHVDFVKKVIEIKPQLVCELNLQKQYPLHLAATKGHVEVVRALLSVDDRVTCLARDRNGLTPVHLAAMKGRDEVVKLLFAAQPDAARILTYQEESILHLCVKNYQLQLLKHILTAVDDPEFLNSKDSSGNTALHLAVADKQIETTKFLVSIGVEVNARNQDGLTAMDVLIQSRRDVRDSAIEESLKHPGGVVASQTTTTTTNNNNNNNEEATRSSDDALMVVAILVATMIFQVGANPPGGVWQDDNFLMDSNGHYVDPRGRRVSNPVDSQNNSVPYPRQAGYAVLARNDPNAYTASCVINMLGFFTSLGVIFILMTGLHLRSNILFALMYVISGFAFISVANSYSAAVTAVTPKDLGGQIRQFTNYSPSVCLLFVAVVAVWSSVKLIMKKRPAAWWRRWPVEVVEDAPEIEARRSEASSAGV